MLRLLNSKTSKALGVAVLLIALYAVAGFVVAPRLVRATLLENIPRILNLTPAVGAIRINPFLLQASVEDFSLSTAGGQKLLGFKRFYVAFELSSLWHRAYSFANIELQSPVVNAFVAADGSLNLAKLVPQAAPGKTRTAAAQTEGAQSPPSLRIASLKVSDGTVTYEDRSRPDAFAARLEPINFELDDFTTGTEGGEFKLTGSSKLGERIEWHGHLSVQPVASVGEFRIDGLLAHTLWEYLQDRLNFVVNSGTIDLHGTYAFSAGGGPRAAGQPSTDAGKLKIDLASARLSNLTVRPQQAMVDWITLPSLDVTGTLIDIPGRHARVDRVSLTGLDLITWLDPDGSFNLTKLGAATATTGGAIASNAAGSNAAAPTSAPVPATLTTSGPAPAAVVAPWTYDVGAVVLRDAHLSFEDRTVQPTVKGVFGSVSLQVTGASQDLTKPIHVMLDTRINDQGSLSVSGTLNPQPGSADVVVKAAGIDLTVLQPYIAQRSSLTLQGGVLGAQATVHYGAPSTTPRLRFSGDVAIDNLHTIDDQLHDDFVNWDRLEVRGINYTQGPDRLAIEQIIARQLYARVIVEADETLNVKRALAVPGSLQSMAAAVRTASASASATAAGTASAAAPAAAVGRVTAAAPAAAGMPISIQKIIVRSGELNFSDFSVQPNFSAGVHQLGGTVVGISSAPDSRAILDLRGAMDQFSPVTISGAVNMLSPTLHVDVALEFHNISLPIFDPYSGKFAGYNITKGKLNTDLHYKVDGRQLEAQHHVIVEQLEFGARTASKDAVSLPVKLAVSLLKDRNGVIDIELPVSGSLDDPQFALKPLLWKTLMNILEKAVAAPFELLGELFGGGPELQFIDFQPGLATLDPAATLKVNTVAKALLERPQLKIDVPIAVVAEIDRPALVSARYDAELAAAQAAAGHGKAPGQLELLTRVYAQEVGVQPRYPDAVSASKSSADQTAAKIDFLSKGLRAHIQVSDADLQGLGQRRALALQQVLLANPELDPERVFLADNDKASVKDGAVRLELTLR